MLAYCCFVSSVTNEITVLVLFSIFIQYLFSRYGSQFVWTKK
jgi:hypothetical protein